MIVYLDPVPVFPRKIQPIAIARTPLRDRLPPRGNGYLAGTFPDGITTVDGVPVEATVRVLYRPEGGEIGDGALVAQVKSNPDGTWRVDGLNLDLKYDVVGRLAGFNDVITAGVYPVPA